MEVVVEADQPPVALGPQLPLADVGGVAALVHGVGDPPPGAAHGPAAPRATFAGASFRARRADLALGVAGTGGTGRHTADEPHGPAHHAPLRSRLTARDVPVASPAALIIGADSVVRATRLLRAAVELIASAEPSTRSKRSRSSRAVPWRCGRPPSTGASRPAAAPSHVHLGDLGAQRAERVTHPHERHREGGEGERAEDRADDEQQLTGAHGARPRSDPIAAPCRHAFGDLLLEPVTAGRYQVRSCNVSGRYCWSTQPPSSP